MHDRTLLRSRHDCTSTKETFNLKACVSDLNLIARGVLLTPRSAPPTPLVGSGVRGQVVVSEQPHICWGSFDHVQVIHVKTFTIVDI